MYCQIFLTRDRLYAALQTWSNLADALVKRAEVLTAQGDAQSCMGSVYGEAMAAYGKACSLCSSEEGDDLPGLLYNWGIGLHSLGSHAEVCYLPPGDIHDALSFKHHSCALGNLYVMHALF